MKKTKAELATINITKLINSKDKLKKDFRVAKPFKHLIIKDFFKNDVAEEMIREFPSFSEMQASSAFSGVAELKSQLSDLKKMPPVFRTVFKDLMSEQFRSLLTEITGIKPLYRDPNLAGGGLHQGGNGSFLDIHADFNLDKKNRQVSQIKYFNLSK